MGRPPSAAIFAPGLYYHRVPEDWRKEEKLGWLAEVEETNRVPWQTLKPAADHVWLVPDNADLFRTFLPLGTKATKSAEAADVPAIFKIYSRGVATCRDDIVYNFDRTQLIDRVRTFIDDYNAEVDRYRRAPAGTDTFVRYDRIK